MSGEEEEGGRAVKKREGGRYRERGKEEGEGGKKREVGREREGRMGSKEG